MLEIIISIDTCTRHRTSFKNGDINICVQTLTFSFCMAISKVSNLLAVPAVYKSLIIINNLGGLIERSCDDYNRLGHLSENTCQVSMGFKNFKLQYISHI